MVVAEWFGEMAERYKLVRDFNRAAKYSFVSGNAPTVNTPKIWTG
jgi:hypothetical protein